MINKNFWIYWKINLCNGGIEEKKSFNLKLLHFIPSNADLTDVRQNKKKIFFWHFKCISHEGYYIQNGLLDLIKRLVPTSTIPCMLHNCTPQNGFPWISSHTHDTRETPEVREKKCISLFSCLCVEHLRVPYPIFLPYKRDVTHVVFYEQKTNTCTRVYSILLVLAQFHFREKH